MIGLGRWWKRVRALISRERFAGGLDEEMAFHRQQMARDLEADGMPPEEASYAAMRQFGNTTRLRERSHEVVQFRIETVAQDVRFAVRQLRKNPGFAVTAMMMLALGTGASSAIFGFVDAALIRPLPYAQPDRLVDVDESEPAFPRDNLSYDDYQDWKRLNTTLQSLDVYTGMDYLLRMGSVSEPVPAARVSDGFFRTLGVQPILGRNFRPGEDKPGHPKIAILSYGTWRMRFGSRREAIGETASLSGDAYTIVGVLPEDFSFAPRSNAEFWVPLLDKSGCEQRRGCHNFYGVGRLKEGVPVEKAWADLTRIAAQLAIQYPRSNNGQSASVQPLAALIVGKVRPILLMLLTGAGLLLLIACVNVSSLLLVRAESRRREMAVRGALGATPARLVRQFITESLLLTALGGGLGVLVAAETMSLLKRLIPRVMNEGAPFLRIVGLSTHTLVFACGVALVAAVSLAVTPLLWLARQDIHDALSEGGRTAAGRLWRRLGANLVVVELIVAMVLLSGAGLLAKSFYRLLHVNMGFDSGHVATVNAMLPSNAKPEQMVALYHEIKSKVSSLPGVQSVGLTTNLPLQCNCNTTWIRIPGKGFHGEHNEVLERNVDPEYLSTLGATLIRGRGFSEQDDANHPQATIINESLSRRYFPGEDPIGKMIGDPGLDPGAMRQVVGVIADIREGALDDEAWPAEYFSIYRSPDNFFSLAVRTAGDEQALLPEMVKTLRGINPNLGVYGEITMADQIGGSPTAAIHEFAAWLVSGFAGLALILGVIGLYGVVAYSVSQRTREIGVRMALGAQPSAVHKLILKEAGLLAAIGIVGGLACSLGAAALMKSLLFGVRAWDVSTLAGVAGLLGAFALLASFIPAQRAARVNPVDALRAE
jgi:macrolide transport system ATP-binding/permease protein